MGNLVSYPKISAYRLISAIGFISAIGLSGFSQYRYRPYRPNAIFVGPYNREIQDLSMGQFDGLGWHL